ncbi:MAG: PAS domain-containing protein, partial [Candidatus Eremiobacteraeota bacterium]|nr:PAS domain-containing protein [Candidatus Eremiobacteraeota bacterium]
LGFVILVGFHGHFQSLGYHESLHNEAMFTDELLSARERLELVVKGSNLGTFDWFPVEDHLDIDDKLWEILNQPVPATDEASRVLMRTIHRGDLERHRKVIGAYLKDDRGVCEVDFRLRADDGHFEVFRFRGKVVRRNAQGRATRVSGTFLDITAEIEAAEEKARWQAQVQHSEKLKTLGILAGGVAHDFNNLLASYIGSLELIEMQVENDAPFLPDLQRARESAMEAAALCDQLLSYAGKRSLNCERFCLNTLIRKMAQLLAVSTPSDVEIDLQLAQQLPLLEGDPSQLRQVVLNLILNAAEAMEGRGTVAVATSLENGRVWLRVKDQGAGMEPEVVARIFDPFFTTKFTGRGLGLAAVYGIVEAHQGKIQVDTAPGRGTTVTLNLPYVPGSLPE